MDLGTGTLVTAARIANEMVNTHAKELRTTKETTSGAIAKMKQMCSHAHAFAELMLEYAASDQAPDKTSCWTAFSGLLDDDIINSADWGDRRPKNPPASSHSVYDIAEFDKFTGSATILHSPAPHVAYQLTAAKAKASELLVDYEALGDVKPISVAFTGKGKAPAKRKRADSDDHEASHKDEDEDDDDGDSS